MPTELGWGVWFPFGNEPGPSSVVFTAEDRETKFTGNGATSVDALRDLLKILRERDHADWAEHVERVFNWMLNPRR